MDDASLPREPDADECRFALSVWPRTSSRPWQALVSPPGADAPLRFDRPMDLVIFLTELARCSDGDLRGLR